MPCLVNEAVEHGGVAFDDAVSSSVRAEAVLVLRDYECFRPILVIVGKASVPLLLLNGVGKNMVHAVKAVFDYRFTENPSNT